METCWTKLLLLVRRRTYILEYADPIKLAKWLSLHPDPNSSTVNTSIHVCFNYTSL